VERAAKVKDGRRCFDLIESDEKNEGMEDGGVEKNGSQKKD